MLPTPPPPRGELLTVKPLVLRGVVDQLEIRHLGCVALTLADLDDARVAAGAVREAGRDLVEELLHDVLGAELGDGLTARREVAAAAERDHLLGQRLDRLRLRDGRLDPAVLDQRTGEVRVERLAVGRVAAELLPGLVVTHEAIRLPAA